MRPLKFGPLTIGLRLTLWYGVVLTASLVSFAGIIRATFARNLLSEIDRALAEELAEIEAAVRQSADRNAMLGTLNVGFEGHQFYEIQVADLEGHVVFQTTRLNGGTLPARETVSFEQHTVNVVLTGHRSYRVASRVVRAPAGGFLIQAADSLELYDREIGKLTAVLLGTIPLILGVALAAGYWLSRRALQPVDQLTKAALAVSASRLDQRVVVGHPDDELGRLAQAFNSMIARLERSFDEMRRFTADAAHELRTPLAVLRGEAEMALCVSPSESRYREVLENQLEEIARLTRLTEELLFLCREDTGLRQAPAPTVQVDILLDQLVNQLQAAAQARDVSLAWMGMPGCRIACDADRLKRLFFNLLDNALKFTPPAGRVTIAGCIRGDFAELVVCDTGVGIAPEHLPRVCQRFYQVDPTRGGTAEGTGLGLAICQAIVTSLGGTLRFDSETGGGTKVTVVLPIARETSGAERDFVPAENTNVSGSAGAPGDGVWVTTQEVSQCRSAEVTRSA